MTSSPRPQGSLGPASLASATNVNLTSECRSPEPRYSESYLLTHRSGAPLSYLSYLQTVQTLTTSGPRSLSSDSDSVAPTVSGSPPVSDIRKQRSGDENREGGPAVIGWHMWGESWDQYDTGHRSSHFPCSGCAGDRCGPHYVYPVTTWHRGQRGEKLS